MDKKKCEYQPLTKQIINGNETSSSCSFQGTNLCQIHNNMCQKCPVFNAILAQLNAFEQIYLNNSDETE